MQKKLLSYLKIQAELYKKSENKHKDKRFNWIPWD